jgi:hypothetical protein
MGVELSYDECHNIRAPFEQILDKGSILYEYIINVIREINILQMLTLNGAVFALCWIRWQNSASHLPADRTETIGLNKQIS